MADDTDDYIADFADEYGISYDEAEDMLEAIEEGDAFDVPLDDEGRPDPDYMLDLAEALNIDVSDLYDLYYDYSE